MQYATLYFFPFRNERDFSIGLEFWNWVKNGILFFHAWVITLFILFWMCQLEIFFLFFSNFSFCDAPLRLGQKAIIIQLCRVERTNRPSLIKGGNQESLMGQYTRIPQFSLQIHAEKDGRGDCGRRARATPNTSSAGQYDTFKWIDVYEWMTFFACLFLFVC